jgi:3-oxoacyl-[acyl-carrier protein] reductase
MKKLEGKTAVVTGGSRDIGRAISVKLAAEGAKVLINYLNNEEKAQETLEMVKNVGGEGYLFKADVRKAEDVATMFKEAERLFDGKVDILVNNAGGLIGRKNIEEQDEEWFDALLSLNFSSFCTN